MPKGAKPRHHLAQVLCVMPRQDTPSAPERGEACPLFDFAASRRQIFQTIGDQRGRGRGQRAEGMGKRQRAESIEQRAEGMGKRQRVRGSWFV